LRRVVARGGSPAFSPDGRWLAFVAERGGNQELYKARSDGSGRVQLTNTYGITESAPSWQRSP
jgi:TolB protein